MPKQKQNIHIPVLLDQVLDTLSPREGERYLDLTAGYGGHASEILNLTKSAAVLVDRDENAIKHLQDRFTDENIEIVHDDYASASSHLSDSKDKFDMILADIGVSSPHLDDESRGFSIQKDGPLDMRMDQRQEMSADTVVNDYSEQDIIKILKEYGEEPKAKRIANLIVQNRPINTTHHLAEVVAKAWPGYSKVHPATRTFQAIRIAVNNELEQLKQSIPIWIDLLKPGGRLAIISFHSLEDSIVKECFKEYGGDRYDAKVSILTKKPLTASAHEIVFNPRARSARLRASKRK